MKYKAIIFDLDGVLISTDDYHFQAWKWLSDSLNLAFDKELNQKLRGVSRLSSLQIILDNSKVTYSEKRKEELANEKNEYYKKLLLNLSPDSVDPEVLQTLQILKEKKIKLAVGSSSKNAPLILQRTNLVTFFDAIIDGNQITHSKPHPEVFLKAAEALYLSPKDCLVIEDAHSGVQAALAGHFDCGGINSAKDYSLCTYSLSTFSQILSL